MRVIRTVASLAVGIAVAGCASNGSGRWDLAEHGVRCGLPAVGGRVHVEIRYAADGTPSALPEECRVARGTRISWLGPDGNSTRFVLKFTGESPAGRGDPPQMPSQAGPDRQKVALVAGNVQGRYKYGIEANGITVDPAIIIDR